VTRLPYSQPVEVSAENMKVFGNRIQDGAYRSSLELTANTVRFVGGKREEGEQAGPRQQEQVQTPVLDDVESIPW
jgi:hypothetical protein